MNEWVLNDLRATDIMTAYFIDECRHLFYIFAIDVHLSEGTFTYTLVTGLES